MLEHVRNLLTLTTILLAVQPSEAAADSPTFDGWTAAAVRDEIRPAFSIDPHGGPDGKTALVMTADGRSGLDGYWAKEFPVRGGEYYRFEAFRKAVGVECPRRSVYAQIDWTDDEDRPVSDRQRRRYPDLPPDRDTDEQGWTEVSATYHAPAKATRATIQLRLRWAPGGSVSWSGISWKEMTRPEHRMVRLAAVHFRPTGGTSPEDNCRMFVPLIERAASQNADLVVLGECLTYVGLGLSYAEVAEPIPGPSTEFFGRRAQKHDLYIVVPIFERDGHLIYNTAALVGPDGRFVGKYRKVCLPRSEYLGGITPGREYPVFQTRFGKLGMMICYDVFFPEVARGLANNGAEIIALPIWGGNPALAAARAIENQVYLVSSTYSNSEDWMKSGVWDHEGKLAVRAKEWGTVAVHEVDLDTPWLGVGNIGDFRSHVFRERPVD